MPHREQPLRVPDPVLSRSRRSAFKRVVRSLFAIALVTVVFACGAIAFAYMQFTAKGPLVANKVYQVNQGLKQAEIGVQLQDAGIISSAGIFTAAAHMKGALGNRLKAGEYEFPPEASIEQVLSMIISGRVKTYKVTIPEGWTTQMAVARVTEHEALTGGVSAMPVEGAIMPETYVFRRGLTRQKMLDDMQAAQAKMLDELWSRRSVSDTVKTKEQAVTLASIVEKETAIPEERPLIASVFHNRLKQGMRLQSDPTIIYGLVGGKGKLDRGLTKDDVASDTAYNTYKIDGLPPGPIANPGRASLEAVLDPPDTGYLYFVADGSGGHAFAKTLEEHNANVAKWRAIESSLPTLPTTVASTAPVEGGLPVPPTPPVPVAVAKPADPAPPVEVAVAAPAEPPAVAETSSTSAVITPAPKPVKLATSSLEPGTWLMVANQLVPIPKQKPRQ
ncbi:MAG: endolytic transglycosylase MltG [Aestuariivirga sp.]|nr:endolytic transglycosylase MltG [Aestuariivirga sp.]